MTNCCLHRLRGEDHPSSDGRKVGRMDPSTQLLPAEQRLLDALQTQTPCNLIDPESTPTAEDMAQWDDKDREIRAGFLRRLLLRLHPDVKPEILQLRGGHITGLLDLTGAIIDPNVLLEFCRIDKAQFNLAMFTGDADFDGTLFTGHAGFAGVTFTGHAGFAGVTFAGDARFAGVTFAGDARFDGVTFAEDAGFAGATFAEHAGFVGATFARYARFLDATFAKHAAFFGATFTGHAEFFGATFAKDARFDGVTLAGDAGFAEVTFARDAEFARVTFAGSAGFAGATFAEHAAFFGATFTGHAEFARATFTGRAGFAGATFTGSSGFPGACAKVFVFTAAVFHNSNLDPIIGETVDLDGAIFHKRARLTVMCSRMSMRHMQLRSGGHLQIHAADISAEGAEFLGRTILADPGPTAFTEALIRHPRSWRPEHRLPQVRVAVQARNDLAHRLTALAGAGRTTTVRSLRTANVGELVLSSVELNRCHFAGAHGLDKLRIDASCQLAWTPAARWWRPWRYTRRHVLAEEWDWRRRYASWDHRPRSVPSTAGSRDRRHLPGPAERIGGQ
ncbi:hypothetical protein OPAG_09265 [Rhodococcus opacus PD630]|nr:hypothetical protein OPAG_09265 [Rhodococcus opacus PD630]